MNMPGSGSNASRTLGRSLPTRRACSTDGSWKEGYVGPVYTTAINATMTMLVGMGVPSKYFTLSPPSASVSAVTL